MSNAISGGLTLQSSITQALDAGATRLNAYSVPVQLTETESYAPGTGANLANKIYQASGSAAASPVSIDLSSVVCVDGSTGFSHVREIIILNDDTVDAHTLLWDFSVSNALVAFISGTTPKITIPGGAIERKSKPLGTNGWTVDSTHKVINLDPSANTVPYRIIVIGD